MRGGSQVLQWDFSADASAGEPVAASEPRTVWLTDLTIELVESWRSGVRLRPAVVDGVPASLLIQGARRRDRYPHCTRVAVRGNRTALPLLLLRTLGSAHASSCNVRSSQVMHLIKAHGRGHLRCHRQHRFINHHIC